MAVRQLWVVSHDYYDFKYVVGPETTVAMVRDAMTALRGQSKPHLGPVRAVLLNTTTGVMRNLPENFLLFDDALSPQHLLVFRAELDSKMPVEVQEMQQLNVNMEVGVGADI
ncbi:hypothetical protein PIB30_115026, partial [Stylosanthes scabra]|nr:hypothetical protein [Stylosanthes scabra]